MYNAFEEFVFRILVELSEEADTIDANMEDMSMKGLDITSSDDEDRLRNHEIIEKVCDKFRRKYDRYECMFYNDEDDRYGFGVYIK